jgi:WD40 repeat protein
MSKISISFYLVILLCCSTSAQELKMMLPKGHTDEVLTISISRDGKYLYSAGRDKTGIVWDIQYQKEIFRHTIESGLITASAFDNSASIIAMGTSEGLLQLINFRTGKLLDSLRTGWVQDCMFNPVDNDQLAFSTGKVFTWDYKKNIRDTFGFFIQETYWPVSYSDDGKMLAAADWDGNTTVWDRKSGEKLFEFYNSVSRLTCDISFKPGTHILATISKDSIRLFDVDQKHHLRATKYPSDKISPQGSTEFRLAFTSDGEKLIATNAFDDGSGSFTILDADSLSVIKYRNENLAPIKSLAAHPVKNEFYVGTESGFIGGWDASAGTRKIKLSGRANRINDVRVLPDGMLLIADNNSIKIIDPRSAKISDSIMSEQGEVTSLDHFDGGKKFIATYYDSVIIWDRDSHSQEKIFAADRMNRFNRIRYNKPANKIFVMSKTSGYARVMDASTLETITNGGGNVVYDGDFSEDGKLLAYGGDAHLAAHFYSVVRADTLAINEVAAVRLHARAFQIVSADIDDNSRRVVFAGLNQVFVFDLITGKATDSFKLKQKEISKAVFSKDANKIFIGCFTGRLIAWDLKTKTLEVVRLPDPVADIIPFSSEQIIVRSEFSIFILDPQRLESWYSISLIDDQPVMLTADKFFLAGPNAAKKMHYVWKDLNIISFEQLDVRYNRPDIVLARAGNTDSTLLTSLYKAWQKRVRKLGIDTSEFRAGFNVPDADFVNRDKIAPEHSGRRIDLSIKAYDSVYKLDQFNIWVNETPVFGSKGVSLRQGNSHRLDTVLSVSLSGGENVIETSVTNVNGSESYRMPLTVFSTDTSLARQKLYYIGIGIDKFKDARQNLNYSVKDVRDLALRLKGKYPDISIDTLFNEKINSNNLALLKKKLQQTSVNDKVIISYSGHGLLSKDFEYYLSTYHVDFANPENGGLPYDALESLLDGIPARQKLMLIDACHSGEVDKEEMQRYRQVMVSNPAPGLKGGELELADSTAKVGMKNSFELMQELFVNVGRSTGATIISAAAGTQLAQERGDLKNGVFTFSILEFMQNHPTATVTELKNYVNKRVPELTNGLQVPTTRTETKLVDWRVW